jgi:AbrB family looped-hinge helix DNA binding protein
VTYRYEMRTTIDKSGRMVIPKVLRDRLGLGPGAVEVTAEGDALRVEPVAGAELARNHGRLVVPPSGAVLRDEEVRALRDVDRK